MFSIKKQFNKIVLGLAVINNPPIPGGNGGIVTIPNPLGGTTDINKLLDTVINFLIYISAPIVTLMVLIGAFYILTAGPDEKNLIKGRQTITWAVVGFIIVLIAKGVSLLITNILKG